MCNHTVKCVSYWKLDKVCELQTWTLMVLKWDVGCMACCVSVLRAPSCGQMLHLLKWNADNGSWRHLVNKWNELFSKWCLTLRLSSVSMYVYMDPQIIKWKQSHEDSCSLLLVCFLSLYHNKRWSFSAFLLCHFIAVVCHRIAVSVKGVWSAKNKR